MSTTTARLTALEASVTRIESLLVAALDPQAPAKVTRKPAKARKAASPKAKKVVTLTRKTRAAFVAKAPWAKGLSTQVIASMCVEDASLVPAGFAIGEGYKAMFA